MRRDLKGLSMSRLQKSAKTIRLSFQSDSRQRYTEQERMIIVENIKRRAEYKSAHYNLMVNGDTQNAKLNFDTYNMLFSLERHYGGEATLDAWIRNPKSMSWYSKNYKLKERAF